MLAGNLPGALPDNTGGAFNRDSCTRNRVNIASFFEWIEDTLALKLFDELRWVD